MRPHQMGEMAVGSLTRDHLAGLSITVEAMEGPVVVRVAC